MAMEASEATIRPAPFNGPLRRNPANPRYFTDDSGRAIYLAGSHTWAVMQDMWLESRPRRNMDYEGFLQLLEATGLEDPWARAQRRRLSALLFT